MCPTGSRFMNGRKQASGIIFWNRCFPTLNRFEFTRESIPSSLGIIGCYPNVFPTPSFTIKSARRFEYGLSWIAGVIRMQFANDSHAYPRRSAGFQPAVSPTSSRQAPAKGKLDNIRAARRASYALRIGNPRYSRLEVRATKSAPLKTYIRPERGQLILVLASSGTVILVAPTSLISTVVVRSMSRSSPSRPFIVPVTLV